MFLPGDVIVTSLVVLEGKVHAECKVDDTRSCDPKQKFLQVRPTLLAVANAPPYSINSFIAVH